MPTLDFLADYDPKDSESIFLAGTRLNAVMLYPNNWQLREELITFRTVEREQIKARTQKGEPVAPITEDPKINLWLSRLSDSLRRYIFPEIRKRNHQGILAGRRLYFVAGLEVHGQGGSFNKSDELIPYKKLEDAEKIISTAKGAIHPAWKEFQGVSHLWISAELLRLVVYPGATNLPEYKPEQLVSVAEWFRKFGEQFCPGNTSNSILDPEITWSPPPEFEFQPFDGEELLIQDPFCDFTPEMLAKL